MAQLPCGDCGAGAPAARTQAAAPTVKVPASSQLAQWPTDWRDMYLAVLVIVCFAIVFYRASEYEHMSVPAWTVGSLALSVGVLTLTHSITLIIVSQLLLFAGMWWHNATRSHMGIEWFWVRFCCLVFLWVVAV